MNHSVCYHAPMIFRLLHLPVLLALAASVAMAKEVCVPATPESPYNDTESVTNVAVRSALIQKARTFSGDIALYATPSNSLEVAFGTSRNGDGILLPGDEGFALGWENGAWYIASPTNRFATIVLEGTARRNLSFSLRIKDDGTPLHFSVVANGIGDAFAPLTASPLPWLFSRDWDAVRVTVNGMDASAEALSIRLDNDPWLFIAR